MKGPLFYSKILLFGEYGIILNSKALAIPYPRFSGTFRFGDHLTGKLPEKEKESNRALKHLSNYFESNIHKFEFLNIGDFKKDIQHGLFFDSTIPSGSGLGSSGALTAAIYDRYSNRGDQPDIHLVKQDLAAIESCFHGTSSGIDPIISWLGKPFVQEQNGILNTSVDLSPFQNAYSVVLINTHTDGNTGALVNRFMEHYKQADFREKIDKIYIPLINQTIDSLITADFSTFEQFLESYSQFQIEHFEEMIPSKMVSHFINGIKSKDFWLKICGSGGGGFILGITRNLKKAELYFNLNQLDYLVV